MQCCFGDKRYVFDMQDLLGRSCKIGRIVINSDLRMFLENSVWNRKDKDASALPGRFFPRLQIKHHVSRRPPSEKNLGSRTGGRKNSYFEPLKKQKKNHSVPSFFFRSICIMVNLRPPTPDTLIPTKNKRITSLFSIPSKAPLPVARQVHLARLWRIFAF